MTFYRTESVDTKPISTCFKRCRRRRHGQVLVPAPTGKAVDVAVHEGAGDTGYTLAKASRCVQDGTLKLGHLDLVIIDEACMVGTNDLRQLLTATTRANAKTVLVGDAHQLAPRQGPRRHVRSGFSIRCHHRLAAYQDRVGHRRAHPRMPGWTGREIHNCRRADW